MALTLLPTAAMAEEDEAPAGEGAGSAPVEAPAETKVAQIGSTGYASLAAAVANAENGDTITLTDNIKVEDTLVVTKTLTLDLAGHTLSNDADIWSDDNWSLISIRENGNLTITGNGTLKAKENDCYPVDVQDVGAQLTIENGTFIGNIHAVYVQTGAAYIKGGTYSVQQKYPDTSKADEFVLNLYDANRRNGTAKLSVSGGTFVKFNPANCQAEAQGTNFCAAGYTTTTTEDNNTYTVVEGENTAVANAGANYNTLANAISAAASGDTVTLLKDTKEDITIPSGKTITLNLNGKTLTNVKDHTILNNGNLTITGTGKVDNISHAKGALYNKGTVVVNGGTFDRSKENGKDSKDSGANSWYTIKNVGSMTIHDGATVQTAGNNTALGKFSSLVSNGYFNTSDFTNNKGLENPILTIDGGTFRGGLNTIKNDDRAKLTISGGTFSNYYQAVVQNHNIAEITGGTFTAASDAEKETYGIYNCGCVADIDLGTLTVSGGTFTGATYAVADVSTQSATVNISNGQFAGTKAAIVKSSTSKATIAISGGLFSTAPEKAYLAEGHFIDATTDSNYPYCVTDQQPESAPIAVTENTEAKLAEGNTVKETDKTAITDALNSGKTSVDGVANAVAPDSRVEIAKQSDVADDVLSHNDNMITVDIKVDVTVTASDLEKSTLTFTATPVATVKVNGTEQTKKVPVTNDMLNGKPITVKLPLPTVGGQLFTPKQILHKFTGGGYEYFINKDEGSKRGAGSFKIEDGCAVFTIYGFSTFELSGTVTYVVPSSGGGSSSSSRRYDVSAPSVKHGDVTVSPKTASKGDTVTITVKPDSGYELDTLTVKDASGSKIKVKDKGDGKFTFTMPASKVTVSAEFAEIETLDFADVSTDAYYYEAVKWAAKKGITGGTGDGTFNPNGSCTRAHIVTFLWRAAGSPEPKSTVSFADVPADSYYAKAVAWAVENGITLGTGDGTFSPNATCTRAQIVTFLYRALGTAPTTVNGFTDVTADAFYADAVAWAVESGVTNGTSASTFSPNNGCTRAQIVTFLYRTMK